jgi:hypothetical protein
MMAVVRKAVRRTVHQFGCADTALVRARTAQKDYSFAAENALLHALDVVAVRRFLPSLSIRHQKHGHGGRIKMPTRGAIGRGRPSGSRMQTPGTSTASSFLCRRVSRNKAEGANTDGEEMGLLSKMGGVTMFDFSLWGYSR